MFCAATDGAGAVYRAHPCRKELLSKQTLREVTTLTTLVKSDVQSMLHRFRDSRLRHHEEVRDCAIMKKYVVLLSISPHDGAAEADALG